MAYYLSGTIEKSLPSDDGSVEVYGWASTEDRDDDGEIVLSSAIEKALPGYLEFPTVRELHAPKAIGRAIEARIEGNKFWFGARIVDSEAVRKVRAGVYKAFSIGARNGRRDPKDPKVITALDLFEVSLCDRPRNRNAAVAFFKADINKSMDDVSRFASLIDSLTWLALSVAAEAGAEGDGSTLPKEISQWVAQGATLMSLYSTEELAEQIAALQTATAGLTAPAQADADGDVTADVDADGDIAKAGARHSAGDLSHIQAIHDHVCSLGAKCDGAIEKASTTDPDLDILKADLTAARSDVERLQGELESGRDQLRLATEEIARLKSQPAPDRMISKAVGAIEKTADGQPGSQPGERPRINFNGLSPLAANRLIADAEGRSV